MEVWPRPGYIYIVLERKEKGVNKMQAQRRDKGRDKPVADAHREYLDEEFSEDDDDDVGTVEKSEIYGKSSKIAANFIFVRASLQADLEARNFKLKFFFRGGFRSRATPPPPGIAIYGCVLLLFSRNARCAQPHAANVYTYTSFFVPRVYLCLLTRSAFNAQKIHRISGFE